MKRRLIWFGFLLCITLPAFADKFDDELKNAPAMPDRLTGPVGVMDGPKKTIHGQCLIRTQEGVSIKLSLVHVCLVEADVLRPLEMEIRTKYKARAKYWFMLSDKANKEGQFGVARVYLNIEQDELLKLQDLLPPGPHAKTDSDGKFELTHTMRSPFFILAYASRSVGGDVEAYHWRVPSKQIDEDGNLLLSNDNLR